MLNNIIKFNISSALSSSEIYFRLAIKCWTRNLGEKFKSKYKIYVVCRHFVDEAEGTQNSLFPEEFSFFYIAKCQSRIFKPYHGSTNSPSRHVFLWTFQFPRMRAPISLLRHRNGNVVNMMFCGMARDMVLYNRETNKTLFESNNTYSGRDIEILCTEARKRETGLVYFFHMSNNLESLRSFYVSGVALSFIVCTCENGMSIQIIHTCFGVLIGKSLVDSIYKACTYEWIQQFKARNDCSLTIIRVFFSTFSCGHRQRSFYKHEWKFQKQKNFYVFVFC